MFQLQEINWMEHETCQVLDWGLYVESRPSQILRGQMLANWNMSHLLLTRTHQRPDGSWLFKLYKDLDIEGSLSDTFLSSWKVPCTFVLAAFMVISQPSYYTRGQFRVYSILSSSGTLITCYLHTLVFLHCTYSFPALLSTMTSLIM